MNKYFIQLFLKENTVILPGFGALTAPNGNVADIMFLPYLKTDDGKLADFIVETEGVDRQDAQNTIAKFIREMETNLSKGESFDIFQFGSFFKNESGEIEFKSWLKDIQTEESQPIVSSDEIKAESAEPTQEEGKETIADKVMDAAEEIVVKPMTFDIPVIDKVVEKIDEKREEVRVQPEERKPEEVKPIVNVVKPKAPSPPKKEKPKVKPPAKAKADEKEKKRRAPVWIFSILLLGIAAFCTYWFWPSNKGEPEEQQIAQKETAEDENPQDTITATKPEQIPPTPEPETETETPVEQTEVTAHPINSEVQTLPKDAKGYFLIGGVYSSLAVAEKKVISAQAEGLNAKILPQGKSKMYISLADFQNKKEANEMLKTLRNKGKKVWILKK